MKEYKTFRGNIDDIRCKANTVKLLHKKICKNNCKHYDNKKRTCKLGYNIK